MSIVFHCVFKLSKFKFIFRNHALGLSSFFENLGGIAAPLIVYAVSASPLVMYTVITSLLIVYTVISTYH